MEDALFVVVVGEEGELSFSFLVVVGEEEEGPAGALLLRDKLELLQLLALPMRRTQAFWRAVSARAKS